MSNFAWLSFLLFSLFVVGCAVGSFLNVCIYRMATERSISWPSSHYGACVRPISSWYNIPLLTYLWLGGRCARCGARFSIRYFSSNCSPVSCLSASLPSKLAPTGNKPGPGPVREALQWGQFPPDVVPITWLIFSWLACSSSLLALSLMGPTFPGSGHRRSLGWLRVCLDLPQLYACWQSRFVCRLVGAG
jgi:prepilin signal peptidase PulO-like enzyme (type II secretory pathway)